MICVRQCGGEKELDEDEDTGCLPGCPGEMSMLALGSDGPCEGLGPTCGGLWLGTQGVPHDGRQAQLCQSPWLKSHNWWQTNSSGPQAGEGS